MNTLLTVLAVAAALVYLIGAIVWNMVIIKKGKHVIKLSLLYVLPSPAWLMVAKNVYDEKMRELAIAVSLILILSVIMITMTSLIWGLVKTDELGRVILKRDYGRLIIILPYLCIIGGVIMLLRR